MSASADDWDRHWEQFSSAAADNPAQAFRHRLALALLDADGAPQRLFDVGSGQGDLLFAAHERWPACELFGVELSEQGIADTRRKVPGVALDQRDLIADPTVPPQRSGWATHAVCSEVLEHVDDPVALLRAACGYLAPGARIVVTVPGGPMSAFDRHIGHRRHFTPTDLGELMAGAGLTVDAVSGAGFPFFNLYRRVVIARGERLVDDVGAGQASAPARLAMRTFDLLFRLNSRRRGWQIVGVGHLR